MKISSTNTALVLRLNIKANVSDGKLILKKKPFNPEKPLSGVIYSVDNSDVVFEEDIQVPITIDVSGVKQMESIGQVATPALKSASLITMLFSITSAIALIKIFQMMDYMVFFSVNLPINFQKFIEIMSSNFFSDLPNIMQFLVNEECGTLKPKFEENGMSCQFFSNSGSLFFVFALLGFVKFIIFLMAKGANTVNTVKSNCGMRLHKLNLGFNQQFFVSILDMFQLDFYLAINLQISTFSVKSAISGVNVFASLLLMMIMMIVKILIYFYSTKVAYIKEAKSGDQELAYTKLYYNFLFLSKDNHKGSYYANHKVILNLIKDPLLSIFLVFFSEIPFLQIGGAFIITSTFFFLELIYKPSKIRGENTRNIISNGIYMITNFIFLVLYCIDGKISPANKELFIGLPLIASVVFLIFSTYYISLRETIR